MLRNVSSLFVASAVVLSTPLAYAVVIDAIAATVGREAILRSEVMVEAAPALDLLQTQGIAEADFEQRARQIMLDTVEQAVERKLLIRQAQLAGGTVSDELVEERLDLIRAQYESPDAFQQLLEDNGETMGDFRERLREQILALSFSARKRDEFAQEMTISESEIAQYYEENRDEFRSPMRIRLRQLFLGASQDADERARVRARLESLRNELVLGAPFADLAQAYSEGPDAESGGLIGWVDYDDLVPEVESVAFALEPGEISDVIETQFGFQVVLVDERQEEGMATYEEARMDIEPILRERYAVDRYERWMDELYKRSNVRILQ